MVLRVIEAKYPEGFRVELSSSDGRRGIADLNGALRGPVFQPLCDKSLFARLKVDDELETVAWSNGTDLAPEYIYHQAFKQDPELHGQFEEWGYR